jgi:hypothetical protein
MNYNIWDKFIERQKRNHNHRKDVEAKIPQLRDQQIYNEFHQDEIIDTNTAVKTLNRKTGLKDQEIVDSLNRLIQGHKIITVDGVRTNKIYLRRNPYAK